MTVDDMGSSAEKSTVLIFQQLGAIVKGEFPVVILSVAKDLLFKANPAANANT
jgi:hypothetical protein